MTPCLQEDSTNTQSVAQPCGWQSRWQSLQRSVPPVSEDQLSVLRFLGSTCHESLGRLSGSGLNPCPRGKGSVGWDASHPTASRSGKDQWGERVCT